MELLREVDHGVDFSRVVWDRGEVPGECWGVVDVLGVLDGKGRVGTGFGMDGAGLQGMGWDGME